jgi:hypothetical protein
MESLTPAEVRLVHAVRATCLGYRTDPKEISESDVHLRVGELIALFARNPYVLIALDGADGEEPLAGSLIFCAEQLAFVAPEESANLRIAVVRGLEDKGAT